MPAAKKTTKKKAKKKVIKANRTATETVKKKSAVKNIRRKKITAPPEDNKPLTTEEIEKFTQLLLEKRREILGDVGHMQNEALDNNRQDSTGDLSNMPIHMADVGTDNYEQEFTLELMESERKNLREIDHALAKIQEGTYGICEGTSKPIGRDRLEAKPEAQYCVEYARMIEQGLVRREEETEDTDSDE